MEWKDIRRNTRMFIFCGKMYDNRITVILTLVLFRETENKTATQIIISDKDILMRSNNKYLANFWIELQIKI
jgi:hypothetical protein